jgi:uncharacterized repeat protein (TIGR03803 family)
MSPSGALTNLYSFCSQEHCADGSLPSGGLVLGTDGDFYGTTQLGGGSKACSGSGCGTIFKITPSGVLTTLHSFCLQTNCPDGLSPAAALIQATDGNFYGTTTAGGSGGGGTIFKITPAGVLTTLHNFCLQSGCTDGTVPLAPLFQDTNGNLYGTTSDITSSNYGTVFSLSVGLGPFVITNPGMGHVGENVKVLGTDLTGASTVAFNGIAADFKVVSPALIETTVPSGATSGKVEVTLPGGTLSSNVIFTVLQ